MDDAFWRDVSYVQMSKNRQDVLSLLANSDTPLTPTELGQQMEIVVKSASRAVRQLYARDLVVCINPDASRHRRYRLTERGKNIWEQVQKLADAQQTPPPMSEEEAPVNTYTLREQGTSYQSTDTEQQNMQGEEITFIRRSTNRRNILKQLVAATTPLTPSDLADATDITLNSASRAVRQLADRGFVRCVNPDASRYRRYTTTTKGEQIWDMLTASGQ